jgi:two-component system chemotaxis sensor kinase CheA
MVSQLRDNAMSIRMLPIGSTFNKFKRVVRDLSSELGKDVELVTEGAETELDKTVLERLNDPLVHIIRNALDHGLETPAARQAAGKTTRGILKLSAAHSGAHVIISISDDGRGMDIKAIQAKALERGLIAPGELITDEEAYMMIFRPGFSTAKNLSNVSGRGVGMDVVKREIDALGGSVSVQSSPDAGSTINLKIPLTLAIIEGLLVRISQEYFVLPLSSVEACIELASSKSDSGNDARLMQYRGDLLPYVDLREYFAVPGEAPAVRQVVVVSTQNEKIGMVVDNVIGDYQTVIKPLGRMLRGVDGLSGATILGDGTVALIVDFSRIALGAKAQQMKAAV